MVSIPTSCLDYHSSLLNDGNTLLSEVILAKNTVYQMRSGSSVTPHRLHHDACLFRALTLQTALTSPFAGSHVLSLSTPHTSHMNCTVQPLHTAYKPLKPMYFFSTAWLLAQEMPFIHLFTSYTSN